MSSSLSNVCGEALATLQRNVEVIIAMLDQHRQLALTKTTAAAQGAKAQVAQVGPLAAQAVWDVLGQFDAAFERFPELRSEVAALFVRLTEAVGQGRVVCEAHVRRGVERVSATGQAHIAQITECGRSLRVWASSGSEAGRWCQRHADEVRVRYAAANDALRQQVARLQAAEQRLAGLAQQGVAIGNEAASRVVSDVRRLLSSAEGAVGEIARSFPEVGPRLVAVQTQLAQLRESVVATTNATTAPLVCDVVGQLHRVHDVLAGVRGEAAERCARLSAAASEHRLAQRLRSSRAGAAACELVREVGPKLAAVQESFQDRVQRAQQQSVGEVSSEVAGMWHGGGSLSERAVQVAWAVFCVVCAVLLCLYQRGTASLHTRGVKSVEVITPEPPVSTEARA